MDQQTLQNTISKLAAEATNGVWLTVDTDPPLLVGSDDENNGLKWRIEFGYREEFTPYKHIPDPDCFIFTNIHAGTSHTFHYADPDLLAHLQECAQLKPSS